jgi:N-dimethylarginine dimethylaminohydrolase
MALYAELQRSPEAAQYLDRLRELGYKPLIPPAIAPNGQQVRIEGGEFHLLNKERMILAGMNRASRAGIDFVATQFEIGPSHVFAFDTLAFHIDTCLCPVIDPTGSTRAVLYFDEMFSAKGQQELQRFRRETGIELVKLHAEDSVGPAVGQIEYDATGAVSRRQSADGVLRSLGQFSVNCLPLPGVLIGGGPFVTRDVEDRLEAWGVNHVITPLTQYRYSAGGVHCATNELPPLV